MNLRCDVCNITLHENVWDSHVTGKKHNNLLNNKKRQWDEAQRSVYVSNFDRLTSESDLKNYFAQFAPVTNVILDKDNGKYAIVEFPEQFMVKAILSRKHHFRRQWLMVKPKNVRRKYVHKSVMYEDTSVPFESIRELLLDTTSVDEQIHILVQKMCMKETDEQQRVELCQSLQAVVQQFFPKCQVVCYGSSVNGVGAIGCDLDILVDFNVPPCQPKIGSDKHQMWIVKELECRLRVLREHFDPTFLETFQRLGTLQRIHLLHTIIKQYVPGCSRVCTIPCARCPLVQFYHPQYKIQCDVSITSSLAVHNSVLIRFFQQLDSRVKPLMFTIRSWAKNNELCNSKMGRLSSYAIGLLVLFYLQNCDPPVLPTVHTLQMLADSAVKNNGWDCHFCMDESKVTKSTNQNNLETLLKGFFAFYDKVGFLHTILCMKTGEALSESEFINHPLCFVTDFQRKALSIQDPFELNINIARSVRDSAAHEWIKAIRQTHERLSTADWSETHKVKHWGLLTMFRDTLPVPPSKEPPKAMKTEPLASTKQQVAPATLLVDNKAGFQFSVLISCCSCTHVPDQPKVHTFECLWSTFEVIRDVFSKALKMSVVTDVLEESLEVDPNLGGPMIKFECQAFYNTWTGRRQAQKEPSLVVEGGGVLEWEIHMSEKISRLWMNPFLSPSIIFNFMCTLRSPNNTEISVDVQPLTDTPRNREFRGPFREFLISYLNKITNLILTEKLTMSNVS